MKCLMIVLVQIPRAVAIRVIEVPGYIGLVPVLSAVAVRVDEFPIYQVGALAEFVMLCLLRDRLAGLSNFLLLYLAGGKLEGLANLGML